MNSFFLFSQALDKSLGGTSSSNYGEQFYTTRQSCTFWHDPLSYLNSYNELASASTLFIFIDLFLCNFFKKNQTTSEITLLKTQSINILNLHTIIEKPFIHLPFYIIHNAVQVLLWKGVCYTKQNKRICYLFLKKKKLLRTK